MNEGRGAQGSSGTREPSLVVPDSVGLVVSPAAAGASAETDLFSENKLNAARLAAGFLDDNRPTPPDGPFSDAETRGGGRLARPVGLEDDLAVLPSDLLGLLDEGNDEDDNRPNAGVARDTPHPVYTTTFQPPPAQLPPPPAVGDSPRWKSQPEPNPPREQMAEDPRPSSFSYAFENLAREVSGSEGPGPGSASRPSLCACKKLAISAMLPADGDSSTGADHGGVGGGAALRPGRVCPNRGREADCLYKVFTDVPLVPSTTVSHKTLGLVLHMHQSGQSGELGSGGGVVGPDAGAVAGSSVTGELKPGGGYRGAAREKVPVEIRRWLMDGVASVHCADAKLREDLLGLVPPTLGQMHLSPDGGGQLIAVHIAAVPLLLQGIATIPGVSRVEGADRLGQVFPSQRSAADRLATSASTRKNKTDGAPKAATAGAASTADRQPVRSKQPAAGGGGGGGGGAGRFPYGQFVRRPIVAPVPVRASDMVSPSMWDFSNLGGSGGEIGGGAEDGTTGSSSGSRQGVAATVCAAGTAALVTSSSSPPFVASGGRGSESINGGGAMVSVAKGPRGSYFQQTAGVNGERNISAGGTGSGVGAEMMMAAKAPLLSNEWESTPGVAWAQADTVARSSSIGGNGFSGGGGGGGGGGGSGSGQARTDSTVSSATYRVENRNRGITITTPQEQQPDSSYRTVGSGDSNSGNSGDGGGGLFAGQYAAAIVKRQKTGSVVSTLMPISTPGSLPGSSAQPNGTQLEGYGSVFGRVGGYAAGAALPESMPEGGGGGGGRGALVSGVPGLPSENPQFGVGGYGDDGGASMGVLDRTAGGGAGVLGGGGFGGDGGPGFGSGVDGGQGTGSADGAVGFEIGTSWVDAVFDGGTPAPAEGSDGMSLAPSSCMW